MTRPEPSFSSREVRQNFLAQALQPSFEAPRRFRSCRGIDGNEVFSTLASIDGFDPRLHLEAIGVQGIKGGGVILHYDIGGRKVSDDHPQTLVDIFTAWSNQNEEDGNHPTNFACQVLLIDTLAPSLRAYEIVSLCRHFQEETKMQVAQNKSCCAIPPIGQKTFDGWGTVSFPAGRQSRRGTRKKPEPAHDSSRFVVPHPCARKKRMDGAPSFVHRGSETPVRLDMWATCKYV